MNKKLIAIIMAIVTLLALTIALFMANNNNSNTVNENNNNQNDNDVTNNEDNNQKEDDNNMDNNKKVLVVYFSAQNHTETIALKIAGNLNAEVFEITPKNEYTLSDLDWTDSNSRVSKEHDNVDLRNIELVTTTVSNWDSYDTILIGYPIWWGIAAWPVDTFINSNDFTGKTVIPFCTSSSSGLGESGELLEKLAGTGNWQKGYRFSSYASDNDIKAFTDSIN